MAILGCLCGRGSGEYQQIDPMQRGNFDYTPSQQKWASKLLLSKSLLALAIAKVWCFI